MSALHGVAGGLASLVSTATLYPFDTIRTRMQVQVEDSKYTGLFQGLMLMAKEEGVHSLFAGIQSSLIGSGLSWGLFFAFNNTFRTILDKRAPSSKNSLEAQKRLLAALFAGMVATLLTNPIWVVNTRIRAPKKGENVNLEIGLKGGVQKLLKEEGVGGLMSGIIPAQILCLNPGIQFVCYGIMKKLILLSQKRQPSPQEVFFIGGLAKIISTIATYPLQVIKSRVQSGKLTQSQTWQVRGLYTGVTTKLITSSLHSAVMFQSFEIIMAVFRLSARLSASRTIK